MQGKLVTFSFIYDIMTKAFTSCAVRSEDKGGSMEHIAFLLPSMDIGGTEKSLLNLLSTIDSHAYQITVLLFRKSGAFLSQIPPWVRIEEVADFAAVHAMLNQSPRQLLFRAVKNGHLAEAVRIAFDHLHFRITKSRHRYYQYLLSKAPRHPHTHYDVAIAYLGPDDFLSTYVLEKVNAHKKIQWVHFDVKNYPSSHVFMRTQYPRFDKIYAVSQQATLNLIEKVPGIADRTSTRYNVISANQCLTDAQRGIGFTDNFAGIRILTVGRLREEKGQDLIPLIVRQLKDLGYFIRWYLVGDGDMKNSILSQILEYDIADDLILLGAQENPYPFYRDSDLYVQTSRHEGYCLTIAEAKVFHLPIVSTNFAGAQEQLDGTDNIIAKECSVDCIRDSLITLLDTINKETLHE